MPLERQELIYSEAKHHYLYVSLTTVVTAAVSRNQYNPGAISLQMKLKVYIN